MECKGAFLCNFVLFCANKSIVSVPEGHGIQEVSGVIPLFHQKHRLFFEKSSEKSVFSS